MAQQGTLAARKVPVPIGDPLEVQAEHSEIHSADKHTTAVFVQDEGGPSTATLGFDFVGAGVSAAVAGGVATVTISGAVADHDHTAPGDGGTLTADLHDSYTDWQDSGAPADPGANILRTWIDDQNGYLVLDHKDSSGVTVRFVRDNFIVAKVDEAGGVVRGQAVYISGAAGANEDISLARADADATMPAFGLVLDAGANNDFVRVIFTGKVQGFDTSAFSEGDVVYVSAAVAGGLTNVVPVPPNIRQRVGVVTRAHAVQGEVLAQITTAVSPTEVTYDRSLLLMGG